MPGPPLPAAFSRTSARNTSGTTPTSPLTAPLASPLIPSASTSFDGIGDICRCVPPDNEVAAGPTQVVEVVNSDLAVYSKSGSVLLGPEGTNTLWSGFGGGCEESNSGDATIVYDTMAQRWVVQQPVFASPYMMCVAVSKTSDATGEWYRYSFSRENDPDYPKIGIWPDAYYSSANLFGPGEEFLGAEVCALNRQAMLSGLAAEQQCFIDNSGANTLLPASVEGPAPPPSGEPEWLLAISPLAGNSLAYWKFHVDWNDPANSSLTGPTNLPVEPFSEACGGGVCIPQAETTQQLDSLADRLMWRLAYRNLGSHQSMVVSHAVTASGAVGMRWYELRPSNGSLTVYQQGTYAPEDGIYRWMGSIAMDGAGDMALGYSASSSSLHPQIRYTGRLASDPLGTMPQGESILYEGAGSQLPAEDQPRAGTRWGDYSEMSVDPSDECTFWYVNEYLPSNGDFNWHTRIGSFKFPSCTVPTITNIQPNTGPPSGGTKVMITGTGLSEASEVKFGATNATSFSVNSSTSITATAPSGSGIADVVVVTPHGVSATSPADEFTWRPALGLAWGLNSKGQLGDGNTTQRSVPVEVSGAYEPAALAGGSAFSLSLSSGGKVTSWGDNSRDELGDGKTSSEQEFSDLAVEVCAVNAKTPCSSHLNEVRAVSGGEYFGAALLKNEHVATWGYNASGQLGNGTTTSSTVPVEVSGLEHATAIAAGGSFALALKGGHVYAWGLNSSGQLGTGNTTSSSVPVEVCARGETKHPCEQHLSEVISIAAGQAFGLALLKDGGVVAWGAGEVGQLGDNHEGSSTVPVSVTSLTNATAIAAGQVHSLALLSSGKVMAWGAATYGQLGNPSTTLLSNTPVEVEGLTEATAIAAGGFHSVALLASGKVKAWGKNNDGELGDGTNTGPSTCIGGGGTACSKVPVEVTELGAASSIAAGSNHTLAVGNLSSQPTVTNVQPNAGAPTGGAVVTVSGTHMTDASEVKFGATNAQRITVLSPTSITVVTPSGAAGTSADVTVRTPEGTSATGAADKFTWREDFNLAFGANRLGELGNESTVGSDVPVRVQHGPFVAVAGGEKTDVALLENGEVETWGSNGESALGDGKGSLQQASSAVPVKVKGLPEPAVAIASGTIHSLALMRNGTVRSWGSNSDDQLGAGKPYPEVSSSSVALEVCEVEEPKCARHLSGVKRLR